MARLKGWAPWLALGGDSNKLLDRINLLLFHGALRDDVRAGLGGPGADGLFQLVGVRGGQQEVHVAGRVLQQLQERILGVGIAGSGAGELIAEGVVAIEMGMTASDLKLSIHPHPTLSETLMESAEVFFGQATHVFKPKKK